MRILNNKHEKFRGILNDLLIDGNIGIIMSEAVTCTERHMRQPQYKLIQSEKGFMRYHTKWEWRLLRVMKFMDDGITVDGTKKVLTSLTRDTIKYLLKKQIEAGFITKYEHQYSGRKGFKYRLSPIGEDLVSRYNDAYMYYVEAISEAYMNKKRYIYKRLDI